MGLFIPIASILRLLKYPNSTNQVLSTDALGNIVLVTLSSAITTVTKSEADLVSAGSGFYNLPITLTSDQQILSVTINESGLLRTVPVQFENGNLINFDNNNTQTIKIKIG